MSTVTVCSSREWKEKQHLLLDASLLYHVTLEEVVPQIAGQVHNPMFLLKRSEHTRCCTIPDSWAQQLVKLQVHTAVLTRKDRLAPLC